MEGSIEQHKHEGLVRTDMNCHNCSKNFIAEIDYSVDGQFEIPCAHCGHIHYRAIKDGKVTESRWGSDDGHTPRKILRVWKHPTLHAQTSTASEFIRNRWLNRVDREDKP
jgi:hypothetical protein